MFNRVESKEDLTLSSSSSADEKSSLKTKKIMDVHDRSKASALAMKKEKRFPCLECTKVHRYIYVSINNSF